MLWWVTAIAAGCSPGGPPVVASAPGAPPPQTVVMFIVCTARADRFGSYGNEHAPTPYMDALAAQGVRFDRVLASSPWTRPSIGALTTGIHPVTMNLDDEGDDVEGEYGVPPEATTLAERFSAAGWGTVGATANPNANQRVGMAQGFAEYHDTGARWRDGKGAKVLGVDVVDAVLEAAAKVTGPLFAQVVTVDTHRPLDLAPVTRGLLGHAPWGYNLLGDYDAALSHVDEAVARLDEGLAALGRSERLMAIVGDHGEGLYRPKVAGRSHATWVYEANLRVPWIVHGPGVAAGQVVSGLATSPDVYSTLLDLVGLTPTPGVAGLSFAAAARGEADATTRAEVLSITRFGYTHKLRLTTDDWTFIRNLRKDNSVRRGIEELYARDDRDERHNVGKKKPDQLLTMRLRAQELRRELERDLITWEPERNDRDMEQLRALGYVDGGD